MEEGRQPQEQMSVLKTVEVLAARAANQSGLELVDVEWKTTEGKPHIVVYIDTAEGVSLEDCQTVSKYLGELLDREDPLPSRYYLEVSSPGIERRLKKADDFSRFVGKDIKIKTFNKINGSRNFRGVLKDFSNNTVILLLENGEELKVAITDIARAHLWHKQLPRR